MPVAVTRSLPSVYVLSFLVASVAVFFEPSKLAILPEIVAHDRLMRANSLLATGDNLTEILGYALAGFHSGRTCRPRPPSASTPSRSWSRPRPSC